VQLLQDKEAAMPYLSNTDHSTGGSGAVLLTLGGLVAAFGVASCCGLPFVLATLGLGTAWLGGFALFAAPLRPFLLAAATLCLAGAAVLLWRQRATICVPGAVCTRPAMRGATLIGLLVGLALLYLGYTYA
jgi:mercuric ion transport protein